MLKRLILFFLILYMFNKNIFGNEIKNIDINDIDIKGESAILLEQTSGRILYEKNPDKKIYPASMTKILTALVALDYIKLDEIIVVGPEIYEAPRDSSKAGHVKGEHITGKNLLRGLIIPSGNETGCIVAVNVAKRITGKKNITYKEAEKIFVNIMNKKAKKLGAVNSNFTNPHGYHDENLYSTVRDIAIISKEAMKKDIIASIAAEIKFKGDSASNKLKEEDKLTTEHEWISHNLLLNSKKYFYKYATGLKTGFTKSAGYCVSATAKKDNVKLLAVVANSGEKERWEDVINLFDYSFSNFKLEPIILKNEKIEKVFIEKHKLGENKTTNIVHKKNFLYYIKEEEKDLINKKIIYDENKVYKINNNILKHKIKAPISKKDHIGKILVTLNNKKIYEGDLNVIEDIEKRTILKNIMFILNFIKKHAFSIYSIPFWVLVISLLNIIRNIIKLYKKRKSRKYLKYKNMNIKRKKSNTRI